MDRDEGWTLFIYALLLFMLVAVGVMCAYVSADSQRRVYEREGIHMSTGEIMMGNKPAERVIVNAPNH